MSGMALSPVWDHHASEDPVPVPLILKFSGDSRYLAFSIGRSVAIWDVHSRAIVKRHVNKREPSYTIHHTFWFLGGTAYTMEGKDRHFNDGFRIFDIQHSRSERKAWPAYLFRNGRKHGRRAELVSEFFSDDRRVIALYLDFKDFFHLVYDRLGDGTWKFVASRVQPCKNKHVENLGFSPDLDRVVSISDQPILWNVCTDECKDLATLDFHPYQVLCSNDGHYAVFSHSARSVTTFASMDLRTGERVARLVLPPTFLPGDIDRQIWRYHCYDPAGNRFTFSRTGHDLFGWHAEGGECEPIIEQYPERIGIVAFSPDGTYLAISNYDQDTVRVFKRHSTSHWRPVHVLPEDAAAW